MSNFRERILAATRIEFLNCISNKDFELEHKVNVHEKMGCGGHLDYNDESEEVNIKSARLSKKKDGDGGFKYILKIIIE